MAQNKKTGFITQETIDLLKLNNIKAGTPILIGETNIEHIKNRHPYEYDLYFKHIEDIIANPDYLGKNPSDGSISYVKLFQVNNEFIRVAVRITSSGTFFAKSLHLLSTCNAERYIKRGTLIKLDN